MKRNSVGEITRIWKLLYSTEKNRHQFILLILSKIMGLVSRKDFHQGNRPQFLPKEELFLFILDFWKRLPDIIWLNFISLWSCNVPTVLGALGCGLPLIVPIPLSGPPRILCWSWVHGVTKLCSILPVQLIFLILLQHIMINKWALQSQWENFCCGMGGFKSHPA